MSEPGGTEETEGEGGDHYVPVELVELYEVLEWQAAVEKAESPS